MMVTALLSQGHGRKCADTGTTRPLGGCTLCWSLPEPGAETLVLLHIERVAKKKNHKLSRVPEITRLPPIVSRELAATVSSRCLADLFFADLSPVTEEVRRYTQFSESCSSLHHKKTAGAGSYPAPASVRTSARQDAANVSISPNSDQGTTEHLPGSEPLLQPEGTCPCLPQWHTLSIRRGGKKRQRLRPCCLRRQSVALWSISEPAFISSRRWGSSLQIQRSRVHVLQKPWTGWYYRLIFVSLPEIIPIR